MERVPGGPYTFAAIVPCRHQQIPEPANVIEVMVGDEHGVDLVERDVGFGQLGSDTATGIEEQSETRNLHKRRRTLPRRIWPRSAGSKKCDAHGGSLCVGVGQEISRAVGQ